MSTNEGKVWFHCSKCSKAHFKYLGKVCPCGEPFPEDCEEKQYRGAELLLPVGDR